MGLPSCKYIFPFPLFGTEEWWDFTAAGEARSCNPINDLESPYKRGYPSPMRGIPGGDHPSIIKPDLMHNFNLGMGGDLAVSALYALCRMNAFGGGSIQVRLDSAFDKFETWCLWNEKSAKLKCFDAKKFNLQSNLLQTCWNHFLSYPN